jgi:acyl-coenzyme A thioesterase PaaI-like protein
MFYLFREPTLKEKMKINTHKEIDKELCGKVLIVKEGFSRVELKTIQRMTVDDKGLVHGGFIFGLADYSARVAVNHPNVVLGAADIKFSKACKGR